MFCDRIVSLGADDKDAGGGFDDVVGDGIERVDLQYPIDLREEPFEETEVAAGDPFDGGDGLCVGDVVGVEIPAESLPMPVQKAALSRKGVDLLPQNGGVAVRK